MKNIKSKKFVISLVGIILVFVLIVGVQVKASADKRLELYQEYCEDSCELTKVSKDQLEATINTRRLSAIASIEESSKSITETKSYLDSRELSDSEAKTYEAIALASEYNSEADYTTDELIDVESDYNGAAKQLHDLKTSYQVRINKTSIKSYKASISDSKKYLKSVDLSNSEKKQYDSYNKDYKAIEYDTEKDYTVKELGAFKHSYKELDTNYSELLKSVKARIKEEEQTEASTQSTWSNDTSYSGGSTSSNNSGSTSRNSGSTSSNSGGTSSNSGGSASNNGGGTTTEVMPDYCYSSESSAYAAAEKQWDTNDSVGFGVYPGCAGNIDWWEIDWF